MVRASQAAAKSVQANVKGQERIHARRQQIVDAAKAILERKSFHEATVRDFADEACLTQGTLYNYIRTKDDILFLVCADVVEEYFAEVHTAIEGLSDPRDRLKSTLRALVLSSVRNEAAVRILYRESHNLSGPALRAVLKEVSRATDMLQAMMAEVPVMRTHDAPRLRLFAELASFLPAIAGLRRSSISGLMPTERLVDDLMTFLIGGLGLTDLLDKRT